MRSRMKMNVGKGRVRGENVDTETNETRLVPNTEQGSANDKELASKYGDPNKITRGDIITAAIENQKKKGMA